MFKFSLIRDHALAHQPNRVEIGKWLRKSLQRKFSLVMLTISIVDAETSQSLNKEYRGKNNPTNVISLEYADSRDELNFLSGELILCDEVIITEAKAQHKEVIAHYAHMLIHGMLHLQGYDHIIESEAKKMEQLEIIILTQLGFANPY